MQSVLCCYDIREDSKIPNPSGTLRRYGFRINMSCWVFPGNMVPTTFLDDLRAAGADVHLLSFAENDWEKVVRLATRALQEQARLVTLLVKDRSAKCQDVIGRMDTIIGMADHPRGPDCEELTDSMVKQSRAYKKWRSVLSRARRELLAAQQCALGFGISRDVSEALAGLENILSAELAAALVWRDSQNQKKEATDGAVATNVA